MAFKLLVCFGTASHCPKFVVSDLGRQPMVSVDVE